MTDKVIDKMTDKNKERVKLLMKYMKDLMNLMKTQ